MKGFLIFITEIFFVRESLKTVGFQMTTPDELLFLVLVHPE